MSTDREAAELQHSIIEAAKVSYREDPALTFVQHLEMQARNTLSRESWSWETHCAAGGVWSLELQRISTEARADGGGSLL